MIKTEFQIIMYYISEFMKTLLEPRNSFQFPQHMQKLHWKK